MATTLSDFSKTSLRLLRPLHCRTFKPSSSLSFPYSSSSKPSSSSLHSTSRNEEKHASTALTSNENHDVSRQTEHLRQFIHSGKYTECFKLLESMCAMGNLPDQYHCFLVLKGLSEAPDPDRTMRLVELLEAEGRQDKHVYNLLIGCLCKAGHVVAAFEAVGRMRSRGFVPKISPCNSIVKILCDYRMLNAALATVEHFRTVYRCKPNWVTYSNLIECAIVTRGVEEVPVYLDQMARDGFRPDNVNMEMMHSRIIRNLCRLRKVDEALEFIRHLPLKGLGPHATSYITLLKLFLILGKERDADSVIDEMLTRLQSLERSHLRTTVKMLCFHGLLRRAREMIEVALAKFSLDVDMVSCSILISAYLEDDRIDLVIELVKFMISNQQFPNVIIYNSMISSLCKNGHNKEAIKVFVKMKDFGVPPNNATYNRIIQGLWSNGEKKLAVKMLERMVKEDGLYLNVITYNLIMTCLSKDGMVDECFQVMRVMETNKVAANIISYNTILLGLCKAARMEEAMWLFEEMLEKGCEPDWQTYCIILKGAILAGYKAGVADLLVELDERKILSKNYITYLKDNLLYLMNDKWVEGGVM
ncbi:hypothetical protein LUZ63_019045 [Rhynchospora breviuscula]|uniref:Pentatricopeptide repeat-containing protein-mitochondrial domain-containing protein n=1 Tax=Rhynchospora breviuscula TaxID=2022672 RepID=A0A9Q0C5H0_9POAL|nr:hypothetical protein LUZ63_019045 [Rhynchospora breviuscula]